MKVLILGKENMVGDVVATYFAESGHFVEDASSDNLDQLAYIVKSGQYDAIINCSAIVNQHAEENKARAVLINSFLPHFLEEITMDTETIVVHRSTDCIFSGNKGMYSVSDIPDGESFYAKTKSVGEIINSKDITIRTSLIGPEKDRNGEGLFNWFCRQQGDVPGFTNAIWTGLTTIEFAKGIEFLLMQHAHGLLQLVPDYSISKYDLLNIINTKFKLNKKLIAINNRHIDKSLVQELGGMALCIPNYEFQICEMKEWIETHLDLYAYGKDDVV